MSAENKAPDGDKELPKKEGGERGVQDKKKETEEKKGEKEGKTEEREKDAKKESGEKNGGERSEKKKEGENTEFNDLREKKKEKVAQIKELHAKKKEMEATEKEVNKAENELDKPDLWPNIVSGIKKFKDDTLKNMEKWKVKVKITEAKDEYCELTKKAYEKEKSGDKEAQAKIDKQYLGECTEDLDINPDNITPEVISTFVKAVPDAYKKAILDPKSDVGEFAPVRDKIRENLLKRETEIIESYKRGDLKYGNARELLTESFMEVTGLPPGTKDYRGYIRPPEHYFIRSGQAEKNKNRSQNQSYNVPESLGKTSHATSSSGSNGGGDNTPLDSFGIPTDMTVDQVDISGLESGDKRKIVEYALQACSRGDIMGARHCTDWVDKVFKNTIGKSVYNFTDYTPPNYNGVQSTSSGTGICGKEAPREIVAAIVAGKHLIVDKPDRGGRYGVGKTHSVITLGPPENGLVKVVSYPNNQIPPKIETYDLWAQGRGNKDGKVLRIQG